MSTSSCFDRLLDDAAVFPPGNAPLDRAVRDHRQHQLSDHASLVGPLLVRDTDVIALDGRTEPLGIGVVVASGVDAVHAAVDKVGTSPRLRLETLEIAVGAAGDLSVAAKEIVHSLASAVPDTTTVSVELPRPGGEPSVAWSRAAHEISAGGFQVKLRTGGTSADAYPREDELAAALATVVAGGHRLKLTAGLHRAVRNTQPGTGFEQHGFLNVMVAVHRLLDGDTIDDAAAVLRDRDGDGLAAAVRSWGDDDVAAVRATFRGFGTCSIDEPYADLVELGLVA